MEMLIISGLSGAGKSRVAAALEDLDFYCVDNMPAPLMLKFAELCAATRGRYERVALVSDIRSREGFDQLFAALDELSAAGFEYKILYVDATVETVVKRYKETRRRHPLDDSGGLESTIRKEMRALEPVRRRADYIIDTTGLTLGRLQRTLFHLFGNGTTQKLRVSVMSFGFKHGLPLDADLVFDVRFMPNPFYIEELRPLTGLDQAVSDYVFSFPQTGDYLKRLEELLAFSLPLYAEEGKTSLVVAVGCTGGRHRSVAVTHALAEFIRQQGYQTAENHRDMSRSG